MKLHDVPRGTLIRVMPQEDEIKTPIASPEINEGDILYFSNIDGMYSLCYGLNENLTPTADKICHLAAWTEVEKVDLTEMFTFEELREKIGRTGYGADMKSAKRTACLSKMSDDWVAASVKFVSDQDPNKELYKKELEYRKANNISLSDKEAEVNYTWL